MAEPVAWLVDGEDVTLVGNEVRRLVAELAGDHADLSVEDFWGDDVEIDAVTSACVTPPFLVDRRVVVLRDAGKFSTEQLAPLLGYLENPMPTTALVVAAGGGRLSQKLVAAIKKVGHVVATGAGRDTRGWVENQLRQAPLRVEPAARAAVAEHLGQDLGRLPTLVDTLVAVHGEGATIGLDDLTPYLGEAGSVQPWDMTDAIDRGDAEAALTALHRLLEAGDRHPLVVLSILHRHVGPVVTLDGSGATSEGQAATVIGIEPGRSTFPAKKALATLRRWGSDGAARAIQLVADADLDLRGESTWPPEAVLEVLVARLCRIAPRSAGARPSTGAGRR
ncbi:MAG: polymerase subunit delta [Acidimicrobiaceae bacterium]|jgi:DNA polymerase-3 subunit delta|nr:polymerase subunit delta [Acidimicrobiaceae bacterium]MDQ1364444.1 polymerase subunit delta [Acidimicrobiaceae bacterium]MDQ1414674.1 polymerase subunit delta [Acidimicrobiaceae bacterium]MDQ1418984.1 polymerase subunit delta [Acidimicrobiaceae bacterium]MDQ1442793.1 polymerase subunit delta [Acidimicrobiaceae bacterium]